MTQSLTHAVRSAVGNHYLMSLFGLYALVTQFGHGRRIAKHRTFWGAFITAFQSRSLYGTLLASLVVAYSLRRTLNASSVRMFFIFFGTFWSIIYRWRVCELPVVSFRRTYWNSTLVQRSKIAETVYQPVIWGYNRHVQTISLYALSNLEWLWADPVQYTRENVPAFDHPNVLHLDWAKLGDRIAKHTIEHVAGNDAPVILFVHGLGDDKDIPYMKRCVRQCLQRGYRCCVFSYWRFDFEESRDYKSILGRIQERYPTAPIAAVAWSAGVYPLLRYLQKARENTPLVSVVCQSGCLDFPQAVDDVFSQENTTYGVFLAHQARMCIYRHLDNDKTLSEEQISAVRRAIREESSPLNLYNRYLTIIQPETLFDEDEPHELGHEGKVKLSELEKGGDLQLALQSASHYTHRVIDHMDRIAVCTLILHAEDDPVVTSHHVDWRKVEQNRHIVVGHTMRGGHCSWYEGLTPFGDTWGDRVAVNWISAVMETHSQTSFFLGLIEQSMRTASDDDEPPQQPQITPGAMSRICSASDFRAFPSPGLVFKSARGSVRRLTEDDGED
ncbi:hypothetical protein BASA81_003948 [Batrachochytrium salamandrivorans]|nr:hypothetical protein BASA81_003948 [Batrachochytrium salamandrivorans]